VILLAARRLRGVMYADAPIKEIDRCVCVCARARLRACVCGASEIQTGTVGIFWQILIEKFEGMVTARNRTFFAREVADKSLCGDD
jgi:hypothetical protein